MHCLILSALSAGLNIPILSCEEGTLAEETMEERVLRRAGEMCNEEEEEEEEEAEEGTRSDLPNSLTT